MIDSKRVLAYGFSKVQLSAMRNVLHEPPFTVETAKSHSDIINTDYFVVLINSLKLDSNQSTEVLSFFMDVDGCSTVKIVIAAEGKIWKTATNATVFTNFDSFLEKLPSLLCKAHARAQRAENLAKNMKTSLHVLQLITDNPGITSAKVAKIIKRGELAARRFIEELRLTGQSIEYDAKAKGWKMRSQKTRSIRGDGWQQIQKHS